MSREDYWNEAQACLSSAIVIAFERLYQTILCHKCDYYDRPVGVCPGHNVRVG